MKNIADCGMRNFRIKIKTTRVGFCKQDGLSDGIWGGVK
jgi:hypothetical protein